MERVQATVVAIVRAVARDTGQRRSIDEGANAVGWLEEYVLLMFLGRRPALRIRLLVKFRLAVIGGMSRGGLARR